MAGFAVGCVGFDGVRLALTAWGGCREMKEENEADLLVCVREGEHSSRALQIIRAFHGLWRDMRRVSRSG